MSKMKTFQVIALTFSMLMIISMVKGRWLDLETYSTSMIYVGVHNISNENTPNLRLEISNSSTLYAKQRCESLYGFLPCADTMAEGVFLMFMYMYLMMLGEEWNQKGSEALYEWIGNKALGASIFRVLMALPKIALVLVSGILSSASDAQNLVSFGVSMYAGSTVITLTLIWGIHIILSGHKLKMGSSPESVHQQDSSIKCLSSLKHKLSFLTDTGVNIGKDTRCITAIMLLSLIPFAFAGLVHFMNTPTMTLFALIVSGVSILLYFGYQVGNPLIQVTSWAYLQQENLRTRFLNHVKRLANVKDLVDEQGNFDFTCFKRIFEEADNDGDKCISLEELEYLIKIMFELEKDNIPKEYAKEEILIHFDKDKSKKISWEEFQQGCTNWLEKWKNEANSSGSALNGIWNQVKKIINKQRSNLVKIDKIMPRVLKQVLEKHGLVKKDGKPDTEMIEGLFTKHDNDENNELNRDELKQFIEAFDFGIKLNIDKVVDELLTEFDDNDNQTVDKKEFVDGFIKWIQKAIDHDKSIKDPKKAIEKFEEDCWEEIDRFLKREKPKPTIVYAIFGIAIILTITSAFITSVRQFSTAAHIPFLFTSFVMVPIALNAKKVIDALLDSQLRVRKDASVTFSEIYNGLVMNNLLGLLTLLAVVYIKGLSWTYSSEMLAIWIPCAIVGLFAFKRDNYPLWASLLAILLYPVSICIYYACKH